MNVIKKLSTLTLMLFILMAISSLSLQAAESSAEEIDREVDVALQHLFKSSPVAAELMKVAKGILVFPDVVKAGVIVGGQYGEGALRVGGKTENYYNTVAGSYGLQLGIQKFGYALILMTQDSLDHLKKSKGWEIGVGPSVVIVDEGIAKSLTTTTAKEDIYAFFFDQKGLMAGLGIQGSKISPITP
ncbi:MAG: lipid-binding SYLF domain-containing protein [Gammaproteobacteria bacterium]|jgi:lipid-binding SYLF domain-containing protein